MAAFSLADLESRIIAFRDARDWKQFHGPKDVAISLTLEAAELLELFQWKKDEATPEQRARIGEELADILYWTILMAHDLGIDLSLAFVKKMADNETKYPVS